jgi:protein-disulfide isomerase
VVASWNGGQLTYDQVATEVKPQLNALERDYLQGRYDLESQATERLAAEAVLELEAAARGLDLAGLLKVEVEDKVKTPTDQEIAEFYPVIKRQLRNAPLDQVKDQVAGALMQRQQGELITALLARVKAKYALETSVPFPDLPRADVSEDDDPSLGPADARVVIIEFGEYQCPYCGKAYEIIKQVLKDYPDDVRLVYRDFPLDFHQRAVPAAVAANCAGDQGKYWEYHELLMGNQRALELETLTAHAQTTGMDMEKFSQCLENPGEHVQEVLDDLEDGKALGVTGTPAFFINGIFLNGAVPYSQFKDIIDRELKG